MDALIDILLMAGLVIFVVFIVGLIAHKKNAEQTRLRRILGLNKVYEQALSH